MLLGYDFDSEGFQHITIPNLQEKRGTEFYVRITGSRIHRFPKGALPPPPFPGLPWFAFVCFLIRSHPPLSWGPPNVSERVIDGDTNVDFQF